MFFPQATLAIFKFLDYVDSEVIKEFHSASSLLSLAMKGQSACKSLPPTSGRQGEVSDWALWALWGTQCKHTRLALRWLSLCSFLSNVCQTQSPSHLMRNLTCPSSTLSLCISFLVSHPADRPTSKITQVSTSVESSAKNIICAKWSDECSERTGCLSS